MLVRDFQQQRPDGNLSSKGAMQAFNDHKENWLEFCMFPDLVEPVRMPSIFPVPTHVVRRQTVQTISPTASSIHAIWKPHTIKAFEGATATEASIMEGYRSGFHYQYGDGSLNNDDGSPLTSQGAFTSVYTPSLTETPGLLHGGARLIGAFIEIEYVGTLDNHAGLIECGVHMHSANSCRDLIRVHGYSQSEILQAPFYRKFKPMDGVRCVWFPADDDAFNFQNYDIDNNGTGEADPDAGVTTDAIDTRLDQVRLRQPVFPEWAINLSGLSLAQGIRIHMCSYYETVPDEKVKDIFMARKTGSSVDTGRLKSAVTDAVQSQMVATPAKSSLGFSQFRDKASSFLDTLNQSYSLYQGARTAFSMF